jgi:vacuolar protein sorting-associated protein 13A/C
MGNIEESKMDFVEEFSVALKMETASTSSVHNLTAITLKVEPIILRLSYQDAMLIMDIGNKGIALMGNEDQSKAPKPSPSDITSDISSEIILADSDDQLATSPTSPGGASLVNKSKGIEPFIVMSKESVSLFFFLLLCSLFNNDIFS